MSETKAADIAAWLDTQRARDVLHGYTPDEIREMPFSQFTRLCELAGFPPIGAQPGTQAPPESEPAGPGADSAGTHGDYAGDVPDFRAMSMQQYAQFRQEAGIGRSASARGIFDN